MEQPVHTLTHLQLRRAAMDLSKLAVAWAEREEGVPPIKRHDPGAIGAAEGQVPAWRDGACIGELQHRVLDVADDLVVLFQQLLQLLNAVLQHRDLALLAPQGKEQIKTIIKTTKSAADMMTAPVIFFTAKTTGKKGSKHTHIQCVSKTLPIN